MYTKGGMRMITLEEQNKKILDNLALILDGRDEEEICTITIEVVGNIGAYIKVEFDAMKEEYECECEDCDDKDINEIVEYLKSKGYDAKITRL
jgi:hypothetical protein